MKLGRTIFTSILALHQCGYTLARAKSKKGSKGSKSQSNTVNVNDVVIIGGGAAGTYAAWRLAGADYDPERIHLFERTDHIGGRLLSPTVGADLCTTSDGDPAHLPRTELGGMRIRSKDKIAIGIMEELGIEYGPFYMNDKDDTKHESPTNPMFARNTLGRTMDFGNPENMIPFKRTPQSFTDADGPYTPTYEGFPAKPPIDAEGFDPCDGETNSKVLLEPYGAGGRPFYSYSFWGARHKFIGETEDMTKLFEALSGYVFDNFHMGRGSPDFAEVLPIEFDKYFRPLKGLQDIPSTLHSAAKDLGVKSSLNLEVTKVEQLDNHEWLLTFRETETSSCTGITRMKNDGGNMKVVRAKKVILALPAAALERIEFVTPKANGALHRKVNELSSETAHLPTMKIFAAWPTRWYNTVNNLDTFSAAEMPKLVPPGLSTSFNAGRFTNDLTGHVFAWYPGTQSRPETIQENAPSCSEVGVFQFYGFPNHIPKFSSAAQGEAQEQCFDESTCPACNPDENDDWYSPGISTSLRELVTQDLSTMFRFDVPDAAEIQYRIWAADDHITRSDGVHFWKAGVRWWESYKEALDPLNNGSLHLIGEVFSHNQGWAEGAFDTAEHLLQEVFGLDSPAWLSRKDYCSSMPFYVGRASNSNRKLKDKESLHGGIL